MNKIDRRKNYILMLDTETCPIDRTVEGVDPKNMLVYDFGFAVVDKYGNVYESKSFVVSEIFFGEMEKMQSGYYANKLPQYYIDIANGSRKVRTFDEIGWIVKNICEQYEIKIACAHNAYFDFGSIKNTKDYLNKKYSIVPYLEWWDTLAMSRSVIAQMPTYKRFCQEHGYMTKYNKVQLKAEILYRYISNDVTFEESHTGLEDVMIEKEILAKCFKQHKKMKKLLFNKK